MDKNYLYLHVGCGTNTMAGWVNLDNSPTIKIANSRVLAPILQRLPLLSRESRQFLEHARRSEIRYCDVTAGLPFDDNSALCIYTSHMVEHLEVNCAEEFFGEAYRVLAPGGVVRIVVPDLRRRIIAYTENEDADVFISSLNMITELRGNVFNRIVGSVRGGRQHKWMYDAASLSRRLRRHGFGKVAECAPGTTCIADLRGIDLRHRESESIYVEAVK